MVSVPKLSDLTQIDTSKPISPLPDIWLTWPGKDQGKPKPPVFWIEDDEKRNNKLV